MAVNKVVYGNKTVMDISDSTIAPDKMLMGTQGYDASGNKITGNIGVKVEDGIMICNGPLFSVQNGIINFKVNVDNNSILQIG